MSANEALDALITEQADPRYAHLDEASAGGSNSMDGPPGRDPGGPKKGGITGSRLYHEAREEVIEKGDPGLKLESVCSVWPGADWMEREVYDMLGIIFTGHPDLRRIMTWNGFGAYPLRKDYPLRGIGEREDYKIITREGA